MAIKLTKAEEMERDEHVAALREKLDNLRAAETRFAELLAGAVEGLNGVLHDYNGALSDARSTVETIAERLRGEYDDKSEKWQAGEKGQAAYLFVENWESLATAMDDLDDIEMDPPEEIEADHAEPLAEVDTEPQE